MQGKSFEGKQVRLDSLFAPHAVGCATRMRNCHKDTIQTPIFTSAVSGWDSCWVDFFKNDKQWLKNPMRGLKNACHVLLG